MTEVICLAHSLPLQATDAMAHVAGFTVAHDVSARDWQMGRNGKQWLLGKTFDTFCPLGPALVTKDSVAGRSLVFATVPALGQILRVRKQHCRKQECRGQVQPQPGLLLQAPFLRPVQGLRLQRWWNLIIK